MTSLPLLSSPPPVVGHELALFNPYVVMVEDAHATAAAAHITSNDRQVRASVRLHPPPAESYLHMQTDDMLFKDPMVLAACGDLLLIHMVVHDAAAAAADLSYKQSMFVYKAHPERPWLRRLPNPDSFTGWAPQASGIVFSDDGGFVVASLQTFQDFDSDEDSGQQESVAFLRYSSAIERWDFKTPVMPYDGDALQPYLWETDKVFSSDGTIYWVDYHRGLLFCNVLAAAGDEPELHFIRLPGIEIWTKPDDFFDGRLYPEAYRTVGACKGIIKFVDIDNGFSSNLRRSGFTVTVWTLKMPELEWDEGSVLQVNDLWTLPNFDPTLPRCVPLFPIVSTQDADVLHFILQEPDCFGQDWIITLDMQDKVLQSYKRRRNLE